MGRSVGRTSLLLLVVLLLPCCLVDDAAADDDGDGGDFDYYNEDAEYDGDGDDDEEFQYGDVYTFEEFVEDPIDKKGKSGTLRFRSNRDRSIFPEQSIDEGFLLQEDHREYVSGVEHPGAGVRNGHEQMDRTHANLVDDIRDPLHVSAAVGGVPPTYRQGQPKVTVQKTHYGPAYEANVDGAVNPAPERGAVKPRTHEEYGGQVYPAKPKLRRAPYGRGGLVRQSPVVSQFGPYQKVKPPFIKAVPVKETPLHDSHGTNPEYYESQEKGGGYHFTSSKKIGH